MNPRQRINKKDFDFKTKQKMSTCNTSMIEAKQANDVVGSTTTLRIVEAISFIPFIKKKKKNQGCYTTHTLDSWAREGKKRKPDNKPNQN